ncbi:MAG: glutamine--fructose-6-phosphate transaminase (isomerizing) [Gammaproteobacteria bacterium]|nr:glutamine--fructose-6-phosphate transaminase (isomerizing) [Gammaproteobacteria bacterium]MDH5728603.1 glutamine--fructose-6-phosphate transaminase (isomerizing) [Gammaproteobacteria bacterium]
MCGIVGAIAERDVTPILVEGLRRLEYRGYDSAGVAVIQDDLKIGRNRTLGKVKYLQEAIEKNPIKGHLGVAHTRWATHGVPSENNAHPHICKNQVVLVHNGIIENHDELREQQEKLGYAFTSDTDTEVIVHQVHHFLNQGDDLLQSVNKTIAMLDGAYAIAVITIDEPNHMVVARRGSPLVIGVGIGERFIASDVSALLPVTNRFMFLEDGDVADIHRDKVVVFDEKGKEVQRAIKQSELSADSADKGPYRHYMLKEIFEQPRAITETLDGRISGRKVLDDAFGLGAAEIFDQVSGVTILACGTSFHAGMVAKYWFEAIAGIPCMVEIASEFRYRKPVVRKNSLVVTISQSGETADTLAALEEAKRLGFGHSLVICNVPESSLVRASDLALLTRAGPEVGVASTKAFTTQLTALMMLVIALGRRFNVTEEKEHEIVDGLIHIPGMVEKLLHEIDQPIQELSEDFADKFHALFLGRGSMYPVAMEGALKLKEISYIHAEAYPAGELKHGPLALVDAEMPVITVAPNDDLIEKLKSNMQEVYARGGRLYVFADAESKIEATGTTKILHIPSCSELLAPIIYTIPLQLLSYHVAVLKGTDVDQPRNLAKSVTVE